MGELPASCRRTQSRGKMALYEAEEDYLEGAWFVGIRKAFAPITQKYTQLLDKATPHTAYRWYFTAFIALVYVVRVWLVTGFFVVSYGLGIYILNLLIPFISPQDEEALLPTAKDDEHRPFMRRLSEFKFWHGCTKAFCIAFVMTFFSFFDVPVFWPILLLYFLMLFGMTMKKQISHMIKHNYRPWTTSKETYGQPAAGGVAAPTGDATKGK